ncbi:MAG: glycosyltransferase family 2 protein [Lachnospiraceae bacterium]
MSIQPLVSVIIPVYQVEQYLGKCVTSILHQTYTRLEILLIDDGSFDNSGKLCDEYAARDQRVKVLHRENGGLMSAWMAGVKMARGEYLTFVDSDDWVEETMVEKLAEKLTGKPGEMVCSNYLIEKKNSSIPVIQSMKPGVYEREDIEKELFPYLLGQERRRIHCSRGMKLISKELILENMKYCNTQLGMGEDMNITLPAILDARRIVIVEEGLYYHYRFVEASMSHRYNPGLYANNRQLKQTLEKILEDKSTNKKEEREWKARLNREYLFLFFYVMKNELRAPKREISMELVQKCREVRNELGEEKVLVQSKANRLLYFIYRHPTKAAIGFGRLVMKIFDQGTEH